MVIEKHIKKVLCDLCQREISEVPFDGVGEFFGKRFYVVEGIFGKAKHADICDDCQHKIRLAAIKEEGKRK